MGTHMYEPKEKLEKLKKLIASGSNDAALDDFLRGVYGIGYTQGHAAGSAEMMDELCPDVGM